jgi:hypothetical protein
MFATNKQFGKFAVLPNGERNKGCSHGVPWHGHCRECEVAAIRSRLEWMRPRVQKDEARLTEMTEQGNE